MLNTLDYRLMPSSTAVVARKQHCRAYPTSASTLTPAQIQALKAQFTDDSIVALTAWIAFQNMSAKFNSALGAEDNALCRRPGTAGK